MAKVNRSLAWPMFLTFLMILGWMPFEGLLSRVVPVGILLTVIWIVVAVNRYGEIAYRFFSGMMIGELVVWSAAGVVVGLLAPLTIIGLMILKTGIHAHGPEFTRLETWWVLNQFSDWGLLGLLSGFGFGLLKLAFKRTDDNVVK